MMLKQRKIYFVQLAKAKLE